MFNSWEGPVCHRVYNIRESIFALDFYTFSSLQVRSSNLRWQSSWFANAKLEKTIPRVDPTVNIFYGVGGACHRSTYHHRKKRAIGVCLLIVHLFGIGNKCEHVWWSSVFCKLLSCVSGQVFEYEVFVYFCWGVVTWDELNWNGE